MAREIIVVTAAYGNDYVASHGGQQALLPIIAEAGADGVEIRRELLSPQALLQLPELASDIASHRLKACYSAPEHLFPDGQLNPHLAKLLWEAKQLNAGWLKLSLGRFEKPNDFDALRQVLNASPVPLTIENDQTPGGNLAPMRRFAAACQVHKLPITLTFDMGNWLWVGDTPEAAAGPLAPAVSYIHVKAAEAHRDSFRAIPPDGDDPRWLALLAHLPTQSPRGIEFPLEGHDLVAVTRHYVELLRKESRHV